MKSESEKVSLRIISTKELLKRNNKLLYQLQKDLKYANAIEEPAELKKSMKK